MLACKSNYIRTTKRRPPDAPLRIRDRQIDDRRRSSRVFTHGGVLVRKALCRRFSVIGQGKKVEESRPVVDGLA